MKNSRVDRSESDNNRSDVSRLAYQKEADTEEERNKCDSKKKEVNDVKRVILRTIKKQKLLSIGIVITVTGAILTALLPPLVLGKIVDTITGKKD